MTKNLIPLSNCQITKITTEESGESDWQIVSNKEVLGYLPSKLTEKEAMGIIHLARKFELEALNIGIKFQRNKSSNIFDEERLKLHKVIVELEKHNNKLATKLEKLII